MKQIYCDACRDVALEKSMFMPANPLMSYLSVLHRYVVMTIPPETSWNHQMGLSWPRGRI